ncbi:MAG: hypothetical protein JSR46_09860 [Verrucomicrobia bacterium]|nr:hypothetical protein [Verrucomicrobiota bacterium]
MTKLLPALLGLLCIGATVGLNGHNVNTHNKLGGKLTGKLGGKLTGNGLVSDYARYLELTNDANLGPNFVPPTVDQLVAAVLDPNHEYALASGLYNNDSILALRQKAIAYMKATYCLDFAGPNATLDPLTGIITLVVPNAPGPDNVFLMLPYTSQNATQIHVAFDSANVERGATGDWYGFQYGELVVPEQSGVLCNGQKYNLGDTLSYFEYNLLNSPIPKVAPGVKVEVLTLEASFVSQDIINSQGYTDSLSKSTVIDDCGKSGFALESIVFYKDAASGDIYTRTRFEATWDKE